MSLTEAEVAALLRRLGMRVFERGWLSSNNVLFDAVDGVTSAVVDTGYVAHAEQTVALVSNALRDEPLGRIVNTHLHSDHCGGNAALQARWPSARTLVPSDSLEVVRRWDADRLSFEATGQRCDRFVADLGMTAGEVLRLGHGHWEVHRAPGHDPEAILLFEPAHGVLIAGDALWEARLAIIFPELSGESGFDAALEVLALAEALSPRLVIPGHGVPFVDSATAISTSRSWLRGFRKDPSRHASYAIRALLMFHMFERRQCKRDELLDWAEAASVLRQAASLSTGEPCRSELERSLDRLIADGALALVSGIVSVR